MIKKTKQKRQQELELEQRVFDHKGRIGRIIFDYDYKGNGFKKVVFCKKGESGRLSFWSEHIHESKLKKVTFNEKQLKHIKSMAIDILESLISIYEGYGYDDSWYRKSKIEEVLKKSKVKYGA